MLDGGILHEGLGLEAGLEIGLEVGLGLEVGFSLKDLSKHECLQQEFQRVHTLTPIVEQKGSERILVFDGECSGYLGSSFFKTAGKKRQNELRNGPSEAQGQLQTEVPGSSPRGGGHPGTHPGAK